MQSTLTYNCRSGVLRVLLKSIWDIHREMGGRGFRIVIFPGGTVCAVTHTLEGYYGSLKQHQTTAPWTGKMLDFDGLNEVIGTPQLLAEGGKYAEDNDKT